MSGSKDDDGKLRYSLLDATAEAELVAVLTYGAAKYTEGGWQHVPDAQARYHDAFRRHMAAVARGELFDQESGLLHAAHAAACLHFLTALTLRSEHFPPLSERLPAALATARRLKAKREAK